MTQSRNKKTETKRPLSVDTRNHIKETLLLMLKKRPFREIRITVLCREAHIARGTFYLYYNTIDDLLEEIINDSLHLIDSMTPKEKQGSLKKLPNSSVKAKRRMTITEGQVAFSLHAINILELEDYRFLVKDLDVSPIIVQKIYSA